jgi:hypothetical protein
VTPDDDDDDLCRVKYSFDETITPKMNSADLQALWLEGAAEFRNVYSPEVFDGCTLTDTEFRVLFRAHPAAANITYPRAWLRAHQEYGVALTFHIEEVDTTSPVVM